MADKKPVPSFNDFIQNDRKKRKAEALAQQIFGKKGRTDTPRESKPHVPGGSLASRVGVTKRSASAAVPSRQSDLLRPKQPSTLSRSATAARLETALDNHDLFSTRKPATARKPVRGAEISIRGAAGPYTVVAQNFAPGTTAADIESVMQPVGGDMMSCKLVAARPTVIAELVFLEKKGADSVIATFNNQKADGRLLYVYLKSSSGVADAPEETIAPVFKTIPAQNSSYGDEVVMDDTQQTQPRADNGRLTPPGPIGGPAPAAEQGGRQNGDARRYNGFNGRQDQSQWQDRRYDQGQGGYYRGGDRGGWGYQGRPQSHRGPYGPRNGW